MRKYEIMTIRCIVIACLTIAGMLGGTGRASQSRLNKKKFFL